MKWKVFVTRKIPQRALDWLGKKCELEVYSGAEPISKKEIMAGVRGKDGLLCLLTDPIDEEVMDAEPKLRAIANYAVGYDNIDLKAATKRGIVVSNTPEVLTDTTAELAWALLFSVARRIAEGDKLCRAGKYKGWAPMLMLGTDLKGKTLGVVGAGRIGTALTLKSRGFEMKILYTDKTKNEALEKELGAKKVGLDELLKDSDFVSLHVPLTGETTHLIGLRELRLMKPGSILVNTSRGPIIDEKVLAIALRERWIRGAGIDVYENEPAIEPELLKLDNVVLLPHLGSATEETRTRMGLIAAKDLVATLEGKKPANCLNPEVFEKQRNEDGGYAE
ncbi:MAG TPA: D-glycerate dehydrogenase [Thermoplasmata archaeon]|nr:D-glycerate dehydrogenase [Thermoplasmata archaeon]